MVGTNLSEEGGGSVIVEGGNCPSRAEEHPRDLGYLEAAGGLGGGAVRASCEEEEGVPSMQAFSAMKSATPTELLHEDGRNLAGVVQDSARAIRYILCALYEVCFRHQLSLKRATMQHIDLTLSAVQP